MYGSDKLSWIMNELTIAKQQKTKMLLKCLKLKTQIELDKFKVVLHALTSNPNCLF